MTAEQHHHTTPTLLTVSAPVNGGGAVELTLSFVSQTPDGSVVVVVVGWAHDCCADDEIHLPVIVHTTTRIVHISLVAYIHAVSMRTLDRTASARAPRLAWQQHYAV